MTKILTPRDSLKICFYILNYFSTLNEYMIYLVSIGMIMGTKDI